MMRPIAARRARGAALLGAVAIATAALTHGWSSPASSGSASPVARLHGERGAPAAPPRALGAADGAVPDGATLFDRALPAVARLDPALLAGLRQAAADASRDGVGFVVNSGWRSRAYQRQLLQEAVATYGSAQEAARWVATPSRSEHVSGDAVDLGPRGAAAWLAAHGARYGLCQVYANEPWHFELRPGAVDGGCPPVYPDPTSDPRMRR